MGNAPTYATYEVALAVGASELALMVQSTAGAKGFDTAGDRAEKHFSALIVAARKSSNVSAKAVAVRLFTSLLLGQDDGQTMCLARSTGCFIGTLNMVRQALIETRHSP